MRVVYTKSDSNLADCFVQDETAAVDSQMYRASAETKGNDILDDLHIRHSRGSGNPEYGILTCTGMVRKKRFKSRFI